MLHLPSVPPSGTSGVYAAKSQRRAERGEPREGRYCGAAPPGGALVAGTRPGGPEATLGILKEPSG